MKSRNIKTPKECYQADLLLEGFIHDDVQEMAVGYTQRLFDELLSKKYPPSSEENFFSMLISKKEYTENYPVKGLYFWGGVGRGKTYLIDNFYNCLPIENKTRIHFHSFMLSVHEELKQLKDVQEPLNIVADRFSEKSQIICFDEFHVSDITDAMLLSTLLEALFKRGVCLVATSNQHPDQLYWDGLQRERFLPAIDLIKLNTTVVEIDSGVDYRFRLLEKAEIYHHPLDKQANTNLQVNFNKLAPEEGVSGIDIVILGRKIKTVMSSDGVVWFEFLDICGGPRSAADYIEIARIFQTVFISNVVVLDSLKDDLAKRFMIMIDEFYDRNVKVIISAEDEPSQLYKGARLAKSFLRTVSRLHEMSSTEYLKRQHITD